MADFNSELGLLPGEEPGSVVLETRPDHLVGPQMVHFAVLTTLAEVAASRTVSAPVVPAAITVNLLAPARPGRLIARGTLLRRGRRLAVAEGEVWDEERRVAKATVTFALV